MSKIISTILLLVMANTYIPVFANTSQTSLTNASIHFKSLTCDDTSTHCLSLSHTSKPDSLAIYRTDDAGNNWYTLPYNLYIRIGTEDSLDSSKGMHIACDQYLQNCLIGLTIRHGHAFVFYGTNNGGQTWKGTIVDHKPTQTMSSEYITHLSCNASSASQCHLLTDINNIYTLEANYNDDGVFGPDSLNMTMRYMYENQDN